MDPAITTMQIELGYGSRPPSTLCVRGETRQLKRTRPEMRALENHDLSTTTPFPAQSQSDKKAENWYYSLFRP